MFLFLLACPCLIFPLSCCVLSAAEPEAGGVPRADQRILSAQRGKARPVLNGRRLRLLQPLLGAQASDVRVSGEKPQESIGAFYSAGVLFAPILHNAVDGGLGWFVLAVG